MSLYSDLLDIGVDVDSADAVYFWCNQYGGTTCKDASKNTVAKPVVDKVKKPDITTKEKVATKSIKQDKAMNSNEFKTLYENASSKSVTPDAIKAAIEKLAAMKKSDVVIAAKAVGLVGMEKKSKSAIVKEIGDRITARSGMAKRVGLTDPKGSKLYNEWVGKEAKAIVPKTVGDEMSGHPLAGMTEQKKVSDIMKNGMLSDNANPRNYNLSSYPKQVDGPKLENSVKGFFKTEIGKNSYASPTIRQAYDSVKASQPGMTLHDFQSSLAKMTKDGKVTLSAYTQSPASMPDKESSMQLDRENKYYIRSVK